MPYNPTDPYRPLFGSLADQKSADLATKYAQKKARIEPTPAPVVDPRDNPLLGEAGGSNLIDVGQASLARAGGNLADLGRSVSNELLGTKFDATAKTGYSNPDIADEAMGVSPELRAEIQADQHQVLTDVAEGNYGDALLSGLKAAPATAVDSFATLAEIAAGAALTAVAPPLGAAVLGRKVKSAADTASKVKKAYDKAKDLKEANRLGKLISSAKNLPAATAKAAGQASILTADLTQQQIQDYRAEHKEDPSPARVATMTLGVLATTIWEPAIIANLFIPNFRKELVKEGQNLVKNLGKGSNLKNIGHRIGDAFMKIGKAGAAEAGQEYIQTWQEILAVNITPEQANDVWSAVASRLDEKTLRDQALTGGILGGFAGGVTRGAIAAPAVAAGTAVDLTKATAKGTVKVAGKVAEIGGGIAQDAAVKAADTVLSPEERESIRQDFKTRRAVVDDKKAEMELKAVVVEKAATYQDIMKDPELRGSASEAQEELGLTTDALKNPKNLKKLKDMMVRKNRAAQKKLELDLMGSTVAKVATRAGKNIKTAAVETAEAVLDSEQVAKAVKATKKVTGVAKKTVANSIVAIKQVRSSAALGLIEMGIESGDASIKEISTQAQNLSLSDLQKSATALVPHSPKAAAMLTKMAKRKKSLLKETGQITDTLVTNDTLSPVISDIADKGKIKSKDAVGAASAIISTLAGRIDDKEALSKIKSAIEIYEESSAFKEQDRGSIGPTDLNVLKDKVANAERRLGRAPTAENIGKAVDAAVETIGKGSKKIRKATFKASVKAQRTFKNVRKNETVQETVKRVQDAMETLDETAEDYADQLDKLLDEKFSAKTVKQDVKEQLPEGKLKAQLEKVEELIEKQPGAMVSVIKNVSRVATGIKKAGYTTAADLDILIKQFPKLGQHPEFYAKLQTYFEPEVTPETETDVIMSKDDKLNEAEDTIVEDSKLVSTFKTLLGCSK